MPKPEQGRIVLVEVSDPQDRNAKTRPAVIVSETDEILKGRGIFCVAITGTLPDVLPEDCVLIPYHRSGHPRTGLKKRCAAMCSWLFEIEETHIKKYLGVVPKSKLLEIIERLDALE